MFERNRETLDNGSQGEDTAKTLMRQMINSMSTKMEIGSPMASMYILGNPDHYCSHKYDGSYLAWSIVDDYRFRPLIYENVNLYEWVQCSEKKHGPAKSVGNLRADEDAIIVEKENQKSKAHRVTRHPFLPAHEAAFMTHAVHCDFKKLDNIIPNFMGGAVPRADKGDREYYCMTMMTLFKPWRTPEDLKDTESNWDQIFLEHTFTARQEELIRNFNLRYECNDARDDTML
ncbi:hypothetical protein B0H13DRAFT_1652104 [Mycena leptocephala]|nr:hypothetical protein B0H13DRAFT_1652104 [Mycena leptocephala]